MAKKSAKSKGFRRQTAKKPYLSRKEIALLCVIVAVVAVAAFFLFRYDDGALKVQNGAVVADGDNWLIANGSNVRGGARYYKLGEIGEIEGYSREKGATVSDANLPEYTFTPAQADSGDVTITVTCGHGSAEAMANYTRSVLESSGVTGLGEIQTAELAGREARWYSHAAGDAQAEEAAQTAGDADAQAAGDADAQAAGDADAQATGDADAQAEEAAQTAGDDAGKAESTDSEAGKYSRSLAGYIDASRECCVIINATSRADTADNCLPDDALLDLLEKAAAAVKLEGQG